MKTIWIIIVVLGLCLLSSSSQSGNLPDNSQKEAIDIEALKLQLSGFNWINPETDVVLIGEVENIEKIALQFYDNQRYQRFGLFTINPCRWISGTQPENMEIIDGSFLFKDDAGNLMKQVLLTNAWMVAGQKFLVVASPLSIRIEGEDGFREVFFQKYIRYLDADCDNDRQDLLKFNNYSCDFTRSMENSTLKDLGRDCITISKTLDERTLGQCIEEIKAAIELKVKK